MLEFVNRTLSEPECATLESMAIVESAEESAFHWTREPDSKSSLNHVPGRSPAPERATDWEPPGALSLSVSEALSKPAVAGSKPIVTEHLAPIASVVGQSSLSTKSPASTPVTPMLAIASGPPPVLVIDTV